MTVYYAFKIGCVLNDQKLKKEIPNHRSEYIVHPGNTKMYRNLCENYWWNGMKGDWKFRFQVFDISTSKAEH